MSEKDKEIKPEVKKLSNDDIKELEWIQLRKEMMGDETGEDFFGKIKRKFKESPLVPIGMFATVCALTYGLRSFFKGDKMMSQKMMRARVLAQGFTIGVAAIGILYSSHIADKDTEAAHTVQTVAQILQKDDSTSKKNENAPQKEDKVTQKDQK